MLPLFHSFRGIQCSACLAMCLMQVFKYKMRKAKKALFWPHSVDSVIVSRWTSATRQFLIHHNVRMSQSRVSFSSSLEFFSPNELQFGCGCIHFFSSAHCWIPALKVKEFRLRRKAVQPATGTSFSMRGWKGWMFWKCSRPKREMRGICWFANGAEVVENIQHTVHKNTLALTSFFYPFYTWPTFSPPPFPTLPLFYPCV